MKKVIQMCLVFMMMAAYGCNVISGEVTDEVGQPISGATITLTSEGSGETVTTNTDLDGTYTFSNLDNGDYTVAASYNGMAFNNSPESASIYYSDATVDFEGYVLREPAKYDLGACVNGTILAELYSPAVAAKGYSGYIDAEVQITQDPSEDGSSTFTCYFTEYDAFLSGVIDGATYIGTDLDEYIVVDSDTTIKIKSLEFTATGNCDFYGTASVSIKRYIGLGLSTTISDDNVTITTK